MSAAVITSGVRVMITDAYGYQHETVALSGVEPGHKFPVVWVERLTGHADAGGRIPWPAESVRPVPPGDEKINEEEGP